MLLDVTGSILVRAVKRTTSLGGSGWGFRLATSPGRPIAAARLLEVTGSIVIVSSAVKFLMLFILCLFSAVRMSYRRTCHNSALLQKIAEIDWEGHAD